MHREDAYLNAIPQTRAWGNLEDLERIKTFNSSIEWRGIPDTLPIVEDPLAVDHYKAKESNFYLGLCPLESCLCASG